MSANPVDYLFSAPREFLVLSGADTPTELKFDGEQFWVPRKDQIIKQDPKNPDACVSGKNSAGEWIPGSLLLKDVPGRRHCPDDVTGNARGEYWSAARCLQHCLGIDPITKEAKSIYADKGLAVLPLNPSPDLVAQVRAECERKAKAFEIKVAQQVVNDTLEVAQARRKYGLTEGLPPEEYDRALEVLEAAKLERRSRLKGLGIQDPAAAEEVSLEDDAELQAQARLMAEKVVAKTAPSADIDKDSVIEALMADPKWRAAFKEKYLIRKKRIRATVEG